MNEFEFELIFTLADENEDPGNYSEALFEAGCDDAVVGIGVNGRIAFTFIREAENAKAAIQSAIQNIQSVIPDAKLLEVKPDVVGATEIADLANCSRQNVQKQLNKAGVSIRPFYTAPKIHLYHLSSIRKSLSERTSLSIPSQIYDVAEVALEENRKLTAV